MKGELILFSWKSKDEFKKKKRWRKLALIRKDLLQTDEIRFENSSGLKNKKKKKESGKWVVSLNSFNCIK